MSRADDSGDAGDTTTAATAANGEDWSTGLPGFATWSAVYLFVAAVFALYVVLLTVLSRAFA